MTVRVRFAPSPTGYLHVGGARTALYNFLYAKACGGTYILRVEDTDEARSTKEFEQLQIDELKWLGINHTEGPDVGGAYGPYRQSERTHIYNEYAQKLLKEKKAFYCFCSEEELEKKRKIAEDKGLDQHYDGTCRNISVEDAAKRLNAGEKAVIRFLAPQKDYTFNDHVRGEVHFPQGMIGDFVIIRSGGFPVYNFCCVIDDYLMKISHVIRAEEHLSNTLRQLMIYEALNAKAPDFAHVSLLIGKDRQKLSKRHGATSVNQYKNDGYIPSAMVNYLCQLGWSHPEEKDIFDLEEVANKFDLTRFNKAPAIFDLEKLNFVNGQHLKKLPIDVLVLESKKVLPKDHPFFSQDERWQVAALSFFKDHILFFKELEAKLNHVIFSETVIESNDVTDIFSWETTPKIAEYIESELNKTNEKFVTLETFDLWTNHLKNEFKIKGKPLFMGMRGVLTGEAHGPELKFTIPLTPAVTLKKRVKNILGIYKK